MIGMVGMVSSGASLFILDVVAHIDVISITHCDCRCRAGLEPALPRKTRMMGMVGMVSSGKVLFILDVVAHIDFISTTHCVCGCRAVLNPAPTASRIARCRISARILAGAAQAQVAGRDELNKF